MPVKKKGSVLQDKNFEAKYNVFLLQLIGPFSDFTLHQPYPLFSIYSLK